MPELPEVQTVVTQLQQTVAQKKITDFWSGWSRKIMPNAADFRKGIIGAKITAVHRHGKHIEIVLDNSFSIVVHLKMTGHFLYKTPKTKNDPIFTVDKVNGYIHHIFTFSDTSTLEFSDMRKFGWLRLMPTREVVQLKSIASLGVDAISPAFNQKAFRAILERRKSKKIGPVLLEQDLIAGIGNIYRSEALFLSGILPTRIVEDLSVLEEKKLLGAIKKVLREAVKLQGTTDGDFRNIFGKPGKFKRALNVYRRTGEPCKKCGTIILRDKMMQRSIFYCITCQK
jgi:formamidopyrimidine-DNA glycosylase